MANHCTKSVRLTQTAWISLVYSVLFVCATTRAQDYSISEIPTFGGAASVATDINNFGVVCGYAQNSAGQDRALMWSSGVLVALETLGGPNSRAHAINDNAKIVGEAENSSGALRAVRWQPGFILDLADLGGGTAAAYDINNNDFVTGWSTVSAGGNHRGFQWSLGGGMTALSQQGQPGGFFSEGYGINLSRDVAGKGDIGFPTFNVRAAFWPFGGAMTSIATQQAGSIAYAVNARDQVVGSAPGFGPFLWQSGSMSALFGAPAGEALDIDSSGKIVGWTMLGGVQRAVIWEGLGILDLNEFASTEFGLGTPTRYSHQ